MPRQMAILPPSERLPGPDEDRVVRAKHSISTRGVTLHNTGELAGGRETTRPQDTINDIPVAIAATLADFEDDQGRALYER